MIGSFLGEKLKSADNNFKYAVIEAYDKGCRKSRQKKYLERRAQAGYKRKTISILASFEEQIMAEIKELIKQYETTYRSIK